MKKHGILNSHISEILGKMGHTDIIVIADCGLPIPPDVLRIDLAYELGKPGFVEILHAVLADFQAEKVTLASEIRVKNPHVYDAICCETTGIPVEFVPHETLKAMSCKSMAVIRTGECTPYANIVLHSGVIF